MVAAAGATLLLVVPRGDEALPAAFAPACAARGVALQVRDVATAATQGVPPFDLLYVADSSEAAAALEARLWRPGLGSVFLDNGEGGGPSARPAALGPALQAALPRQVAALPAGLDADALLAAVAELGGFPVVVKVPGGQGGRGVIRADSAPALLSLLDYLPPGVQLVAYFPHVLTFRLVVVGDTVAAAEAWCPPAFDFRTNAGGVSLGPVRAPDEARRLAIDFTHALGRRFGGVDLMQHESGALRLAEVNCPCHFLDLQRTSGVDIAGLLLDELLATRGRASPRHARAGRLPSAGGCGAGPAAQAAAPGCARTLGPGR